MHRTSFVPAIACITAAIAIWFARAGQSLPILGEKPANLAGLHNVLRVTDKLISGSSPEMQAGFESLKKIGVRTIISVDGAKPDIARAAKFGMRYVHLPIGYSGVPDEQCLRIARAIRDLPGLVYLHRHHGKHRGPAAAAVARICLDEKCTTADAIAFLNRAGTDPRYAGLFESVKKTKRPTPAELDKISATFPEVARVSALATVMVEIDEHWENLKLVKKAGWKVPPNHPDIDPVHEAAILAQHYRESAKAETKRMELSTWLDEAGKTTRDFVDLLKNAKPKADVERLEKAFQRMSGDCARCHQKYRDAMKE